MTLLLDTPVTNVRPHISHVQPCVVYRTLYACLLSGCCQPIDIRLTYTDKSGWIDWMHEMDTLKQLIISGNTYSQILFINVHKNSTYLLLYCCYTGLTVGGLLSGGLCPCTRYLHRSPPSVASRLGMLWACVSQLQVRSDNMSKSTMTGFCCKTNKIIVFVYEF